MSKQQKKGQRRPSNKVKYYETPNKLEKMIKKLDLSPFWGNEKNSHYLKPKTKKFYRFPYGTVRLSNHGWGNKFKTNIPTPKKTWTLCILTKENIWEVIFIIDIEFNVNMDLVHEKVTSKIKEHIKY